MNKRFTKLIAAVMLLLLITPPLWVWGQNRTNQTATLNFKTSSAPSSPTMINNVSFDWSGTGNTLAFVNSASCGFLKNGSFLTVTIPTGAILKGISKTNTTNSWGGSAKIYVYTGTSVSGTLVATITQNTNSYSITSNNTGTTYYIVNNTSANAWTQDITIEYEETTDPTTIVSTTSLTGFTYAHGTTPTQTKSFKINGFNLTNNITVSLNNANFVMSESENGSYSTDEIVVLKGSGTVTDKYIYVRQASGLGINNEYTGTITVASEGVSTDKTVDLSGSVTGYTVTYDANGATIGTVPTDATAYEMDATVTVKTNSGSLAKTHFTFGGWNTQADGNGTNYTAGTGQFNIIANTTLYAKWVPITHQFNTAVATSNPTYPVSGSSTVEAKDSGNNTVTNGSQVTETAQLTLTATPESGFVFGSWSDGGNNSTLSSTSDNPTTFTMGSADVTITATFIPTHTFTYSVNNSTYGSMNVSPSVESGSAVAEGSLFTITATPADASYKFKQWNVTGTGSSVTSPTEASTTFTMGTAAAMLQAEFAPVYTVTYAANGGSGTMTDSNSPYFANTEVTLLDNTFTFIGHTFSHWTAKDASNNNVTITDGKIIMPESNVTVTANWTTNSYECTLTKTGETEHANAQLKVGDEGAGNTIPYGTEVTIEVTPDSGYTYAVSAIDGENNEVTITNNQFTVPANTVAVTVNVLKIYNVTVAQDLDHGTISADLLSGVIGTNISLSSTPSSGYCLYSWDVYKTDAPATKVVVTNNQFTMPAYDVTVSAMFSPTVTDELTATIIGQTSYGNWNGKSGGHDAVYAGNSTKGGSDGNAIQIRDNSKSGIVTTISGGKAKKVKVTWNSSTVSGRTLQVFGKNSAYSGDEGASDLYDNDNRGTLIGTIVYGTSTELAINDDYEYIGMRSSSGAMYLDNIQIDWAPTPYTLTYDANGGSGELVDHNNPYIYNMVATVLEGNTLTPPTDKVFQCWNANAAGDGKDYYPGDTVMMPKSNKTLYAKWADPCDTPATMNATNGEAQYVNNSGNLSYEINLSSSVSALSECAAIYEYGFVYSTSVEEPTVGADNCTKIVKGNANPTINEPFTDEIANALLSTTYYIRSYATNLAGTAYGEKATVTIGEDFPSYIISYTTNGKTETATTKVYQGNAISELLEAPTTTYVPTGYIFKGWYGSEYSNENTAPIYVNVGDVVNSDTTLKAVFAESNIGTEEVTKSYGWENADDATEWTIDDIVKTSGQGNTGTYAGKISVNNTYVTFKNKVKVKEFSFAFKRTSNNENYFVYIETSSDNSEWTAAETYPMKSFNNGSYLTKTKTFDGTTEQYVRFHCYNTTATRYVDDVTIKYNVDVMSYSNYCTSVANIITNITTDTERPEDIPNYEFVTVKNGATLTFTGNNLGTAANLIVEEGGQLDHSNTGVYATMKKGIAAHGTTVADGGFYFISAPMTSLTIDNTEHTNILSNSDLYIFDQTRELEWQNYKKNNTENHTTFTTLDEGKGYLYANDNTFTALFMGELAYSDGVVPVSYSTANTDANMHGWNLIGNPFACNAYLTQSYYGIDPEGGRNVVARTGAIAPCEGVMVQAASNQTSVTFSKTAPQSGSGASLQMTIGQQVMNRDGVSSTDIDNAIVSFNEGNELPKFYFGNPNANLYIPQGEKEYAILSTEAQGELPLNFRANENGQFTLTVNPEGVEMNYLHLIDNMTGNDIDLLQTPSYSFNAKTTDYESRFRLVFAANNESGVSASSTTFAFYSNGNWMVNNEGEATLQVIDVMGRVLSSQTISGTAELNLNQQPGVYVLRLVNGNDVKTQKIVVK